ncbi:hypothetical protein MRAB57_472 [Mycobacterium rhizamassiliense]|uniref:PPE family protein n=1 Tax=Mycobacterium rhizamassiliense TaxID=1841860 RepID=A0A2U3NML9_9MYCO|nr:PPE domain-containing protein [Mycobacterium rhizamassiliense]SPM32673.1 hypothetical protein MRAB57_472 [Mycobacterium rhizamassiliense]
MDFMTLPPEVNSTRMYAGPGAGPMLAAAAAWEAVSTELYSTANSYQSVISGLASGPWLGPSSVAMVTAASTYVAWLTDTAAQAEETAVGAQAAAAAYEAAFVATVPPPEVAANRSLLASLVATNLLGQNTPAIAATETQYGEMWAQDVAAMFGYAGSAAAASRMTTFKPPQLNTNSGGLAGQANTVAQAGEVPASLTSATPALGGLSPLDALDLGADGIAFGLDAPMAPVGAISLPIDLIGAQTGLHTDDIVSGWDAAGNSPEAMVRSVTPPLSATTPTMVSTRVAAGLGESDAIGGLSVPPTWVSATPAVRPIALALPAAPAAAAPAVPASFDSTFGEMAMAGTAGRALRDGFGPRGREQSAARQGARVDAAVAGDDAVPESEPRTVVTGIAAEIREFARLRDEGLVSDEEYDEQRNRLLGR